MIIDKNVLIDMLPQDFIVWLNRVSEEEAVEEDYCSHFPIGELSPLEVGDITRFVTKGDDLITKFDNNNLLFHFGSNFWGSTVCMSLHKNDYGYIYYHDNEEKRLWSRSAFESYITLPSNVPAYLDARENNTLPKNILGLDDFYYVADSFEDFLSICEDYTLDDDEEPSEEDKLIIAALENCNKQFLVNFIRKQPEWENENGMSLAMLCSAIGFLDSLKFLIERGVNTNKCLFCSRSNKQKQIEEYLLSVGVNT